MIMSMYRARPIDPSQGGQILYIVEELSRRAKLRATPSVYVIPSMTLNAFATGTRDNAVIGITEGLLRRLSLRELAGVLAHELSHVRNNDLSVMSLADMMTRFTQALSYLAIFLAIFNLPALAAGRLRHAAPGTGAALPGADHRQPAAARAVAHARVRRRSGRRRADRRSARAGLGAGQARALSGPLLGGPDVSGARAPHPAALAAALPSPDADRVARLLALENRELEPPIEVVEEPFVSPISHGPGAMQPRYRFPGVWF